MSNSDCVYFLYLYMSSSSKIFARVAALAALSPTRVQSTLLRITVLQYFGREGSRVARQC